MPGPFPGMDPFIEAQVWGDFHTRFNTIMADSLGPSIRPGYVARIEHRVVVETPQGDQPRYPDVAVVEDWSLARETGSGGVATLVEAVAEPMLVTMPEPVERREHYIEIRDAESGRVVTVIETLSPANKRLSSDTRAAYERKRDELLASKSTLVEIDLLRGGRPFETGTRQQVGTYRVFISKPWERPRAELYPVAILRPLPVIPVPLDESVAAVPLSLQQAVNTVYERADYSTLNYAAELDPPLPEEAKAIVSRPSA